MGIASFQMCQNKVEKKMQSLFFNEGGASPPDKTFGQDQSNKIGIGTFIEKIAFPEKPFRFGTVFAQFLLVKNLWIGE